MSRLGCVGCMPSLYRVFLQCGFVSLYQKPIIAGYTADELLADVLTLDCKGRQSVRDYIELQMKASRNNK